MNEAAKRLVAVAADFQPEALRNAISYRTKKPRGRALTLPELAAVAHTTEETLKRHQKTFADNG